MSLTILFSRISNSIGANKVKWWFRHETKVLPTFLDYKFSQHLNKLQIVDICWGCLCVCVWVLVTNIDLNYPYASRYMGLLSKHGEILPKQTTTNYDVVAVWYILINHPDHNLLGKYRAGMLFTVRNFQCIRFFNSIATQPICASCIFWNNDAFCNCCVRLEFTFIYHMWAAIFSFISVVNLLEYTAIYTVSTSL